MILFPQAVVTQPDDLLRDAQNLLDAETEALYADPAVQVSCGPDCNTCCEHAVLITAAEVRAVVAAVEELPAATRDRIAERSARVVELLDQCGLAEEADAATFTQDSAERYFALGEPCPLLIDGACSVRQVRPLVCRDYLISSPAKNCSNPRTAQIVRIRRRRAIDIGFARISAAFGEEKRHLLPMALTRPAPVAEPALRSGAKMARVLLAG